MLDFRSCGGMKRLFSMTALLAGAIFAVATARSQSDQTAAPAPQHHTTHPATSSHHTTTHHATPSNAHASHRASANTGRSAHTRTVAHRRRRRPLTAHELARSRRLQHAFVASSQLRPMAQQLAQTPTPAAYAGVSAYARSHSGEAAAAAYLALGHAYLLERKFPDAVAALHSAHLADGSKTVPDGALADYADYLTAQAFLQNNQLPQAETVLDNFAQKYPDSIFVDSVPILRANLMVQEGDPQAALATLNPHRQEPIAGHADFQLALAKSEAMAGHTAEAQQLFEHVYLDYPLSIEAGVARSQLATNGVLATLPAGRAPPSRRCALQCRPLTTTPKTNTAPWPLSPTSTKPVATRSSWRQPSATGSSIASRQPELNAIPDTNDETGARRMYLLMELARDRGDAATQQSIVAQMETRFPTSAWLAEALYSSGNMYLLLKDYPHAITYYGELATRFPTNKYAPSAHWRTGWLNYRLGQYPEAARLFDEQIRVYAGGKEIPSALYWRGRIYEEQEHKPASAAAYYRTILRVFPHYYYAMLAQDRLTHLGSVTPDTIAGLDALQPVHDSRTH